MTMKKKLAVVSLGALSFAGTATGVALLTGTSSAQTPASSHTVPLPTVNSSSIEAPASAGTEADGPGGHQDAPGAQDQSGPDVQQGGGGPDASTIGSAPTAGENG